MSVEIYQRHLLVPALLTPHSAAVCEEGATDAAEAGVTAVAFSSDGWHIVFCSNGTEAFGGGQRVRSCPFEAIHRHPSYTRPEHTADA